MSIWKLLIFLNILFGVIGNNTLSPMWCWFFGKILWHVDWLLGNDREGSSYVTAVTE
jgi:hypothetical protein